MYEIHFSHFVFISSFVNLKLIYASTVYRCCMVSNIIGFLTLLQSNEIVQVEVYLRSEGVLVRFWYPIEMLERPPQGLRKSSITGGQILDTSNIFIHR